MRKLATALAASLAATAAAAGALDDCVDINADDRTRLGMIVHIDDARASAIEAGRPWPSVGALTAVRGIGPARLRDIEAEGLACVGRRAPAGRRERLTGTARVLDADTIVVADTRVRLIGIDGPEGGQLCQVEDRDWACGEAATVAVDGLIGTMPVACEVYGRDRWDRALAVCYQDGVDLNAEIVRRGWALAWYPEGSVVAGPNYDEAQREAELKATGIWQGSFLDPWAWRRRAN